MNFKIIFSAINLFCLNFCFSNNIVSVQVFTPPKLGIYDKFEVGIQIQQLVINNPYDPDEIRVVGEFVSPTNQIIKVDAFWYKDFQICNCPSPVVLENCGYTRRQDDPNFLIENTTNHPWRIRFAPKELGEYKYRVILISNNQVIETSQFYGLEVFQSSNKGFIKVSDDDSRRFQFSKGDQFIPIGFNWATFEFQYNFNRRLLYDMEEAIDKLSQNGGNTIRFFLTSGDYGVEWENLGNYNERQNRAFILDKIFEYALSRNIYLILVLHGSFEIRNNTSHYGDITWDSNPYKQLLGINEHPIKFYSNQACIKKYKQRMRYLASRYGYSTNLLAYEQENETDGMHVSFVEGNSFDYQYDNPANVLILKNWMTGNILEIKKNDNNHIHTTSMGFGWSFSRGAPNDAPFYSDQIDFTQEHMYNPALNQIYQKNYFASRAIDLLNKPYMIGEFGNDCRAYPEQSFTNVAPNPYTSGNYFHDVTDVHNVNWGTLFSNAVGPGLYWWSQHMMNACWGGQYRYFKPISAFIQNEDFIKDKLLPYTNTCEGSGPEDDPENHNPVLDDCYEQSYTGLAIEERLKGNRVVTNKDDKVEVFLLKNSIKVLGWVHNKNNYWYNLPHQDNANCKIYPHIDNVETVDNVLITIKDMCEGDYKVEFYSTFPEYDINNDGIKDDGGIIDVFTINTVSTSCGELTFEVPKMTALKWQNEPYAPDYAFKIIKKADRTSWKPILINSKIGELGKLDIESKGNHIVYRGVDNVLHHDYPFGGISNDDNSWAHTTHNNIPGDEDNVFGDITSNSSMEEIYYHGKNNSIQTYFYIGNGNWQHGYVSIEGNANDLVKGNLVYLDPKKVLYHGKDNHLQFWWFNNNSWQHGHLTNNSSQLIEGFLDGIGNDVYYKGLDKKLHRHFWNTLANSWQHEVLSTSLNDSQDVYGTIEAYQDGVYFIGKNNELHRFKKSFNLWTHEVIYENGSPLTLLGGISLTPSGNTLFYVGMDSYIRSFVHSPFNANVVTTKIICPNLLKDELKCSGPITSYSDTKVFYIDQSNKIRAYVFDNACSTSQKVTDHGSLNVSDEDYSYSKSNMGLTNHSKEKNYTIYPTAAEDYIKINFSKLGNYHIILYNLTGIKVLENSSNQESLHYLDINNLESGVFILKIQEADESEFTITKILKI